MWQAFLPVGHGYTLPAAKNDLNQEEMLSFSERDRSVSEINLGLNMLKQIEAED